MAYYSQNYAGILIRLSPKFGAITTMLVLRLDISLNDIYSNYLQELAFNFYIGGLNLFMTALNIQCKK